jgi:serine/threonine protein kinase
MRYVHLSGIIHGDLKPGNILLSEKQYPLICDFGSSRLQSDDATPTSQCGTVCYAAPEQYVEKARLTSQTDVFSFGLLLYEILVGQPVFSSLDPPFDVIRRLRARDLPQLPASCGDFMQDLVRRCWLTDPDKRPSFHEILSEFRCKNFCILPGAYPNEMQDYCEAIVDWERQSDIPQ